MEIGWNPLLITPEREDTWKPNNYVGISLWEHTLMGSTVVSRLQAFATMATRSIRYQEPSVPELDGGLAPEGRERELARTD